MFLWDLYQDIVASLIELDLASETRMLTRKGCQVQHIEFSFIWWIQKRKVWLGNVHMASGASSYAPAGEL